MVKVKFFIYPIVGRAITIWEAIVGRAITIWEAIQKKSHEPIYKTYTEKKP